MTKMLAIRLPEKIDKQLARIAKKTKRTKTELARQAILEHLEDLEDYYLALSRLAENLSSIPLEEVERKLGVPD